MEPKKNKEQKVRINGHIVSYEPDVNNGIQYLIHYIDQKESKVFFDQAFSKGFAFFEDQQGRNYKLIINGSEYQLIKA